MNGMLSSSGRRAACELCASGGVHGKARASECTPVLPRRRVASTQVLLRARAQRRLRSSWNICLTSGDKREGELPGVDEFATIFFINSREGRGALASFRHHQSHQCGMSNTSQADSSVPDLDALSTMP